MNYMFAGLEYDPNYLQHHGIKGQKWGIRRFQNEDGTLTPAGRERYGYDVTKVKGKHLRKQFENASNSGKLNSTNKLYEVFANDVRSTQEYKTLDAFYKKWNKIKKEIQKYNPYVTKIELGPNDKAFLAEAILQYQNKSYEIFENHAEDFKKTILQDLGYEDTKVGRDYIDREILRKIPFVVT